MPLLFINFVFIVVSILYSVYSSIFILSLTMSIKIITTYLPISLFVLSNHDAGLTRRSISNIKLCDLCHSIINYDNHGRGLHSYEQNNATPWLNEFTVNKVRFKIKILEFWDKLNSIKHKLLRSDSIQWPWLFKSLFIPI